MAKGICNEAYIYRAHNLSKNLMIEHIKEALDVIGYQNGSDKVLKMDKCQASYLRGIYKAFDLMADIYLTLKKQGGRTEFLTDLLDEEFFADYIIDRYAFEQILYPELYEQYYQDAVQEDNLFDLD